MCDMKAFLDHLGYRWMVHRLERNGITAMSLKKNLM